MVIALDILLYSICVCIHTHTKRLVTHFEHLTVLVVPPLDIDNMVPKKEVFSVPQLGQGP